MILSTHAYFVKHTTYGKKIGASHHMRRSPTTADAEARAQRNSKIRMQRKLEFIRMKKHSNTSQTQSLASEILPVSVIVSHVLQTERSKSQDLWWHQFSDILQRVCKFRSTYRKTLRRLRNTLPNTIETFIGNASIHNFGWWTRS